MNSESWMSREKRVEYIHASVVSVETFVIFVLFRISRMLSAYHHSAILWTPRSSAIYAWALHPTELCISENLFTTNVWGISKTGVVTMCKTHNLYSYSPVAHAQSTHTVTAKCSFTAHPDWLFSSKIWWVNMAFRVWTYDHIWSVSLHHQSESPQNKGKS